MNTNAIFGQSPNPSTPPPKAKIKQTRTKIKLHVKGHDHEIKITLNGNIKEEITNKIFCLFRESMKGLEGVFANPVKKPGEWKELEKINASPKKIKADTIKTEKTEKAEKAEANEVFYSAEKATYLPSQTFRIDTFHKKELVSNKLEAFHALEKIQTNTQPHQAITHHWAEKASYLPSQTFRIDTFHKKELVCNKLEAFHALEKIQTNAQPHQAITHHWAEKVSYLPSQTFQVMHFQKPTVQEKVTQDNFEILTRESDQKNDEGVVAKEEQYFPTYVSQEKCTYQIFRYLERTLTPPEEASFPIITKPATLSHASILSTYETKRKTSSPMEAAASSQTINVDRLMPEDLQNQIKNFRFNKRALDLVHHRATAKPTLNIPQSTADYLSRKTEELLREEVREKKDDLLIKSDEWDAPERSTPKPVALVRSTMNKPLQAAALSEEREDTSPSISTSSRIPLTREELRRQVMGNDINSDSNCDNDESSDVDYDFVDFD